MMLLFRAAAPLNNKESKFSERYLLQMSHFSHQGAADFFKTGEDNDTNSKCKLDFKNIFGHCHFGS